MNETFSKAPDAVAASKPKRKALFPALGAAALLSVSAPDSASAGEKVDWGQVIGGVANGYIEAQRRSRQVEDCLRDRVPYAEISVRDAERRANFAAEEADIRAAREVEELKRRTDLTPAEIEVEKRRIAMERRRQIEDARADVDRARVGAQQQVDSCRPRY